jgi:putative ABC transport system substrate-binding protein
MLHAKLSLARRGPSTHEAARVHHVGASMTAPSDDDCLVGADEALARLGWIEGRSVAIEYRWGEGRVERYAEIAAEFVRLNVDVILAGGTEVAIAAKQATSVIPIVFSVAGDPIGSLLVASLARPGGNVTVSAARVRGLND